MFVGKRIRQPGESPPEAVQVDIGRDWIGRGLRLKEQGDEVTGSSQGFVSTTGRRGPTGEMQQGEPPGLRDGSPW